MSSEFGIYQVTYTPTEWCDSSYVEPSVKMSISGEADLSQMLSFFECFLKASGYEFEGKELRLESSAPDFGDISDFGTSYVGQGCVGGASYWGGYPDAGATYKGSEGAQATGGIGGKGAE